MCRWRPRVQRPGWFSERAVRHGTARRARPRRTPGPPPPSQRAVAIDSTDSRALEALSVAAATLGDTVTARKALALLQRQRGDSSSDADFGPRWFLAAITGGYRGTASGAAKRQYHPQVWRRAAGGTRFGHDPTGASPGPGSAGGGGSARPCSGGGGHGKSAGQIRWNQDMLPRIRGASGKGAPGGSSQGAGDIRYAPDGRWSDFRLPVRRPRLDGLGQRGCRAHATDWIGARRECCIPRFAAGEYALATNRLALAERAAQDLLRYHGPSLDADSAFSTRVTHQYGLILEAQIAARRRDPSAAARLRELDSVLANPLDAWMPSLGNLVAAQLHEARGELGAALAAVRRRSWGQVCPHLCRLPPRGRSARRPHRGHHRRDPRLPPLPRAEGRGGSTLQARVQQVRAALAALERAAARH